MTTLGPKELKHQCLTAIVRPILLFCIRHSIRLQDLLEVCKASFVELGGEELERQGTRVSISKISVMTGVHRKDVSRILSEDYHYTMGEGDLISRILGRWQHDEAFTTTAGEPRVLSFEGQDNEFSNLVVLETKELKPHTVLYELERLNMIEKTDHGLKLLAEIYIPTGNVKEGFHILSRDHSELLLAAEENILQQDDIPNLHIRTEYDNIPESKLQIIRNWLLDEGSNFHRRMRNFLSSHDRDIHPNPEDTSPSIRVSVSAFSHTEGKSSHE